MGESHMGSSFRGTRERNNVPGSPPQYKSRLLTHKLSLVLARQHAANSTANALTDVGGLSYANARPVSSEFGSDRVDRKDVLVESWSPSLFASPQKTVKFLQVADRKCVSTQQQLFPRLLELTKSFGFRPPTTQTQVQTTGSVAMSRWFLSSCYDFATGDSHVSSRLVSNYVPHQWFAPERLLAMLEADLRTTERTLTDVEEKAQATHLELEQLEQRKVALLDYIKKTRVQLVKAGKKANTESKEMLVTEKTKERLMSDCAKQASEKQFQIRHLQTCLATCHEKFRNASYAEIFDILDSDSLTLASKGQVAVPTPASVPTTPQQAQAADNDKMKAAALELIRTRETTLAPMQEELAELEARARRHETDHRNFMQQKQITSQVMRGLAQDRFATIVDVQELVTRHADQLAKLEAQGDEQVDSLARLTCYRDELLALLPMLQNQKRQSLHNSGRVSGVSLSGTSKGGLLADSGDDSFPRSERIAARDFLNQETDFDLFDQAVRLGTDVRESRDGFDVVPLSAPSGLEHSALHAPSPPRFRGETESVSGSYASSYAEESWEDGSSKDGGDVFDGGGHAVPKVVTATHPLIEEQSTISTVTYSQKSGAEESSQDVDELDEETRRNNLEELRIQVFDEYWQALEAVAPKQKKKNGTARIAAAKNRALAHEKEALAHSAAEIKPSANSRMAKMWSSVSASTRRADYLQRGDLDAAESGDSVPAQDSTGASETVEEGLQLDVPNVDMVWRLDAAGDGDSHYGLKVNPSVSLHAGAYSSPKAHGSDRRHPLLEAGSHMDVRPGSAAEDNDAVQNLGVSAVRKGVRISTKVLGRHDVQPTITKVDPYSAVGLKEADRLKVNMERSLQRSREEEAAEAAEQEQVAAETLARLKRLGRVQDATSQGTDVVKVRTRMGKTRSKVRFGDEEGEALTSTGVSATTFGNKRLEATLGTEFDYAKLYSAIGGSNSFDDVDEEDEGHCRRNFYPFSDYDHVPRLIPRSSGPWEMKYRATDVPGTTQSETIVETEEEEEDPDEGSEFAACSLPSFGGVVAVKVTQSSGHSVSSRLSGSRQDTIQEESEELDSFDEDSSSVRSESKFGREKPPNRKLSSESLSVEGVNKDYRKTQRRLREREATLAASRPAEEGERRMMSLEDKLSEVHRPTLNYSMDKAQTLEELRDLLLLQASLSRVKEETPLLTPPLTPSSGSESNDSLPLYSDAPLPLSVLAAAWKSKSAHKPKKAQIEQHKSKTILIKKSCGSLSKTPAAPDDKPKGIGKKFSRFGDLHTTLPVESLPVTVGGKFPVEFTVRLAEKTLSSFDKSDELWFCEDLAKSLKLPSVRHVRIQSLSAGSVVIRATAYFDDKDAAKAASNSIARALGSIGARFGKTSLTDVLLPASLQEEEEDDEPLYADLSALIEGELDEAHLKKAGLDGNDQSDWGKSELSTQLLGRCLAGLEKKLEKPVKLMRGKEPTKAALAKILRDTRSRGVLSTALSAINENTGTPGGLGPDGLLGAGLANAGTAARNPTNSRKPSPPRPTDRKQLPSQSLVAEHFSRNLWDSSERDLQLPLVGAALRSHESPLLQSSLAALRLKQERVRTRQSQSQSLNQICGTLLEDADEDLMVGYAAVLRASALPETQQPTKHLALPAVKNEPAIIFDDEDPKPPCELVVTGAGSLPSARPVATLPKGPSNTDVQLLDPTTEAPDRAQAAEEILVNAPISARSYLSVTASEEALELSSAPTAPPAPLMPGMSSSSYVGVSAEDEADIERELRAELRRLREEKRSAAVAKSLPTLPNLKPAQSSQVNNLRPVPKAAPRATGLEVVGGGNAMRGQKKVSRPEAQLKASHTNKF